MRNTAIAIAALGAALSTCLTIPAIADDSPRVAPRAPVPTESVEVIEATAPAPVEVVTNGDGKPVTLAVLQNEAAWRAATAQMLKKRRIHR